MSVTAPPQLRTDLAAAAKPARVASMSDRADAKSRREAEIDAAWELHTRQSNLPLIRRQWLLQHVRAQKGRCAYCGVAMRHDIVGDDRRATIDHVIPRSAGGPDEFSNTVAACQGRRTERVFILDGCQTAAVPT